MNHAASDASESILTAKELLLAGFKSITGNNRPKLSSSRNLALSQYLNQICGSGPEFLSGLGLDSNPTFSVYFEYSGLAGKICGP